MEKEISRRQFLQLTGLGAGVFLVPKEWGTFLGKVDVVTKDGFPSLKRENLPLRVKEVLDLVPKSEIDKDGYLVLLNSDGTENGRVPCLQTDWNKRHFEPYQRLNFGVSWGIVLHWYGDDENFDKTAQGYLRGFNSTRQIGGYESTTSAHFLIGENPATVGEINPDAAVGILQTQKPPYKDGAPSVASHLRQINFDAYLRSDRHWYPLNALYDLKQKKYPGLHSVLMDIYDGSHVDPNFRTIAIEMAGKDFDISSPSPTEKGNAISVVWALLKWGLKNGHIMRPWDVLGHFEVQPGKPDPGKEFISEMRFLLGVKALAENDPEMRELIFGQFQAAGDTKEEAVKKYFTAVREYLELITVGGKEVFDWEAKTGYWLLYNSLFRKENSPPIAYEFRLPIDGEFRYGYRFLNPSNHEGVDLNSGSKRIDSELGMPVYLVADGECLFAEEIPGCGLGKTIIFRHTLKEGQQIISVYGHLDKIAGIKVGEIYKMSQVIGAIGASNCQLDTHLHFALGYSAVWDRNLKYRPYLTTDAKPDWILENYVDPIKFIEDFQSSK